MKNILKTLVEIPSINGNRAANNEALEYVDRFLSEHAMHVKRFDFNGVESLVATTQKTKRPKLLLAGHIDVVAAPERMFTLREKDGRYSGRGVFDMKFAVAAYLQLVSDLNGSLHEYDFGLMITTDEENGGENGTSSLIREEGYKPGVVVLPDAGDTPEHWKLERSAKGKLELVVKTTGKSAHGARPWQGESAIYKLIALLDDVHELFKDQGPKTNSLNIGVISGGEAHNLVPSQAEAILDIRPITDNDADDIIARIGKLCEKYDAELVVKVFGHACSTDKTNPLVAQFIDCVEKVVTDNKLVESDSTGASDARFFAKAGVPCVVVSPPGDGYHMDHEWVSKKGLEQLYEVLRLYTEQVAKLPAAQEVDAKTAKV